MVPMVTVTAWLLAAGGWLAAFAATVTVAGAESPLSESRTRYVNVAVPLALPAGLTVTLRLLICRVRLPDPPPEKVNVLVESSLMVSAPGESPSVSLATRSTVFGPRLTSIVSSLATGRRF